MLRLAAEPGSKSFDLAASLFDGVRAIDFFRCVAEFFRHGKLRSDTASRFSFTQAAGEEARKLLLGRAPGDHQAVKILVESGFHDERGFDESGVARAAVLPFVELVKHGFADTGMDNGVEPIEFGAVGEDEGAESGAVDAAPGIRDGGAEFTNHVVVGSLAGFDQSVGKSIGVEDGEAHFAEHGGHGAFAAGDAAGEAKSEHAADYRTEADECEGEGFAEARRSRAALTVLLISMVMVMGPTPPGTGVSAPAVCTAPG